MKKMRLYLFSAVLSFFACAAFADGNGNGKTQFDMRFDQLKNMKAVVVILPPDRLSVYGTDFMGNAERNDLLSSSSDSMIRAILAKGLGERGIRPIFYEYGDLAKRKEACEVYNLGNTVARNILSHTFKYDSQSGLNMDYIAKAATDFTYSLGDISHLTDKNQADGVLLFYFTGFSERASSNYVSGTALVADRNGNILTMYSRWARNYATYQDGFDMCFNPFWELDIWNRRWEASK